MYTSGRRQHFFTKVQSTKVRAKGIGPECSQLCFLLENCKGAASRYCFEVVGCVLEFVKAERKFTFSVMQECV